MYDKIHYNKKKKEKKKKSCLYSNNVKDKLRKK